MKSWFTDHGLKAASFLILAASVVFAPTALATDSVIESENNPIFKDLHLPIYSWSPAMQSPQGILVALHGGVLHGRSYRALGQELAKEGYMLVSEDMRGYGKWYFDNFGEEKDKTFDYHQTMRDFAAMVKVLRSAYPGVPIYLIGESLGANLSVHMVTGDYQHLVDGTIMASTYARPKLFFNHHLVLGFIKFCTRPHSQVTMVPYIRARLSDNPEWRKAHMADPLGRNEQKPKQMLQSMRINFMAKYLYRRIPSDTPILVLHGGSDKLCSLPAARMLFHRLPVKDKKFVVFPKKGHLLVETPVANKDVVKTITQWLDSHSPKTFIRAQIAPQQQVELKTN